MGQENTTEVLRGDGLLATARHAGSQEDHSARTVYAGLGTSAFRISMIEMAFDQGAPWHAASSDHVVVVLDGAVEFTFNGRAETLGPLDQLRLPRGSEYSYRATADSGCRFLALLDT
jgi:quercetin dioxygenase-like cupin family protein